MKLIFDIETVGVDFDSLDETSKESLTRWMKKEAADEEEYERELVQLKEGLGFSPLTGEIVAIGILDLEKNQGKVFFSAASKIPSWQKDTVVFEQASEEDMIRKFWEGASNYQEFITFNGRGFDVPFILIRGAKYCIKATKDLMSNRYLSIQKFGAKHIDLLDQLSFYGALRRRGNLHMWTRHFGIKSPKAEGVTGDEVGRLYKAGEYKKIAEYNALDLIATRELYFYWEKYLRF